MIQTMITSTIFYMEQNRRNKVFIDTGAFIAFVLETEPHHKITVKRFQECFSKGIEMITTDYILDELLTFLRCKKKVKMEIILSFLSNSYSSGINVFGISEDLFGEAVGMMTKYKDHYFSCTDCVSFSAMKKLKIKNVLTTDKHFTVAGFNNLLDTE